MSDGGPEDGWARHAREQRRAWLKLTYAERLAWLEDAQRFYAMVLASRARDRAK